MTTTRDIQSRLRSLANPDIAEHSQRFFKTGKGEYGEGDRFLGIRVPVLRAEAKAVRHVQLRTIFAVLRSRYHEERLLALFILVEQYKSGDLATQKRIYNAYLDNTLHINNWDLVDSSAYQIVGQHLQERSRKPLYTLAKSTLLWERRIAIIATYYYIKRGDFNDTLKLATVLLGDAEDLLHKATGWMLREVGRQDIEVERAFLDKHAPKMPRTMLRYAIEHLPEAQRQAYLRNK